MRIISPKGEYQQSGEGFSIPVSEDPAMVEIRQDVLPPRMHGEFFTNHYDSERGVWYRLCGVNADTVTRMGAAIEGRLRT